MWTARLPWQHKLCELLHSVNKLRCSVIFSRFSRLALNFDIRHERIFLYNRITIYLDLQKLFPWKRLKVPIHKIVYLETCQQTGSTLYDTWTYVLWGHSSFVPTHKYIHNMIHVQCTCRWAGVSITFGTLRVTHNNNKITYNHCIPFFFCSILFEYT